MEELVSKPCGYSEIKDAIKDAPMSYLPALFVEMVKACERKKVFAPGGMERLMENARKQIRNEEESK